MFLDSVDACTTSTNTLWNVGYQHDLPVKAVTSEMRAVALRLDASHTLL